MKKQASENKDFTVEISFLQGLRARMPHDVELLKILGDDYTKVGRYEEGLEIDFDLVRLLPKDPIVYYNLACSLSLLNRLKESSEALIKAIQCGYLDWNWLQKDSDLKNLRASDEFQAVQLLMKKTDEKFCDSN